MELRPFLLLYAGILAYYEMENLMDVDDRSKPRGCLNLKGGGINFYVNAHKQHDHPPTEYTIILFATHDINKWKICAPDKADFDRWIKGLSVFLGKCFIL